MKNQKRLAGPGGGLEHPRIAAIARSLGCLHAPLQCGIVCTIFVIRLGRYTGVKLPVSLISAIQRKPKRDSIWPPIVVSALSSVGIIALYLFVPGFHPVELLLLFVVMAIGAAGYTRRIVRGVITFAILYLATVFAATIYEEAAPYVKVLTEALTLVWETVKSILLQRGMPNLTPSTGGPVTRSVLSLSFALLTLIIWVVLELITRASFPTTRLPKLGILDNLGGILIHLAVGLLVASLLFNTLGYGSLRWIHNQALLRPRFNQILQLYYTIQAFWFSSPPPIYAYDVPLS